MRAQRIHDAQRIKKKRTGYHSRGGFLAYVTTPRFIGIMLHTPAMCSCPSCGNPRKHFGKRTIQERREMQI